jgi:hypothetical protein
MVGGLSGGSCRVLDASLGSGRAIRGAGSRFIEVRLRVGSVVRPVSDLAGGVLCHPVIRAVSIVRARVFIEVAIVRTVRDLATCIVGNPIVRAVGKARSRLTFGVLEPAGVWLLGRARVWRNLRIGRRPNIRRLGVGPRTGIRSQVGARRLGYGDRNARPRSGRRRFVHGPLMPLAS